MSRREEERRVTRLPIRLEVHVSDGQRTLIAGKARDVSQEGMYVFVDKPLPRGTSCAVVLLLTGPKSTLRIEVGGTVMRADDHGMAITFTDVSLENLFHLRNLVQYNVWMIGEEGKTI